jgi:hypothetical protein
MSIYPAYPLKNVQISRAQSEYTPFSCEDSKLQVRSLREENYLTFCATPRSLYMQAHLAQSLIQLVYQLLTQLDLNLI